MSECIFCNIANKKAKAAIIFEDESFLVFPDIRPKAQTHLLVIPRKHIPSLMEADEKDIGLIGGLLETAKKVAQQYNLPGYKLQMNVGKEGGQDVDHIHLHLMARQEIINT